jgi:hypothetical protein
MVAWTLDSLVSDCAPCYVLNQKIIPFLAFKLHSLKAFISKFNMAFNSKKRTMEASSDSDIAEVVPESDSANSQPHEPKKSWVWQYFKTETVGNKSYNICQASRVPGGSVLCLKQLAVDKEISKKSMSNHLNSCHGLKKATLSLTTSEPSQTPVTLCFSKTTQLRLMV